MTYLRDPDAIYRQSFATIAREADLAALPADLVPVATRIIHACGMTDIVGELRFSGDVARAARAALARGAAVLCDARMVLHGIIRPDTRVECLLDQPDLRARAQAEATTLSAAAIGAARARLGGAVIAIGNAPTALFRLLEEIAAGAPKPAAIFAFPVGFVGAVESKAALAADPPAPFLTLLGRRGGSAMAAAAINAL